MTHVLGPLQNNVHVGEDPTSGRLVVVDPSLGAEPLLDELVARREQVEAILLTHGHFDHIGTLTAFQERLGVPTVAHEGELEFIEDVAEQAVWVGVPGIPTPQRPDRLVVDGDTIQVGSQSLTVIETPGHSPGGLSFYSEAEGFVLVGDALFAGSVGRTDLPGSNHDLLIRSIREKLYALPNDTVVYPGHGPATTIGREKASNPFA